MRDKIAISAYILKIVEKDPFLRLEMRAKEDSNGRRSNYVKLYRIFTEFHHLSLNKLFWNYYHKTYHKGDILHELFASEFWYCNLWIRVCHEFEDCVSPPPISCVCHESEDCVSPRYHVYVTSPKIVPRVSFCHSRG